MAKIGNWGSGIKFQTSDKKVLTFTGMKRKATAQTSKHNMINGRPRLEFHGADLQTVTFTIELNAMLGVKPKTIESKLIKSLAAGTVAPLVIGGRSICRRAMLTGLSSSYNVVLKKGEVLSMNIDVTMTEYN